MVVDTYHRYSNEAEKDIYDDFKMKKKTLVSMVLKKFSGVRVNLRLDL